MLNPKTQIVETRITRNPTETQIWAEHLLCRLSAGAVLALHGELGSGKTCFVQGLARAMGITQPVWSPTFTLIHEYNVKPLPLFHVDLYRIADAREAEQLGLEEYFDRSGITVIEWAERAAELLPARALHIHFQLGSNETERIIRIQTGTA